VGRWGFNFKAASKKEKKDVLFCVKLPWICTYTESEWRGIGLFGGLCVVMKVCIEKLLDHCYIVLRSNLCAMPKYACVWDRIWYGCRLIIIFFYINIIIVIAFKQSKQERQYQANIQYAYNTTTITTHILIILFFFFFFFVIKDERSVYLNEFFFLVLVIVCDLNKNKHFFF
jgi:hypothetical protein